jgi:class 3 adenylate cyclase/tetratricopeptide (TPR) repeat protein
MGACPACGKDVAGDFAFCPYCGATQSAPTRPRELRKVVTVLFCDITGSTELGERLDPEALRLLLARYFERMKTIVERHGGSVEKFIGDAVMAVFGVPTVHEDDALRALRAAAAMRDALPDLGIDGRIGVMTGEVVTGTEERLATGDAVNVAARLEQAAQPGEILIGHTTLQLTRDAADVEPVAPLAVKGKGEPLVAYRLLAVHGDEGLTRRVDTPLVGRTTELRRLRDAYDQAAADDSCQLFTILGSAGVGKSRLAAEFLTSLEQARICRGRCLPYGEGITYWPVVEVIKQLPEVDLEPRAGQGIRALVDEGVASSSEQIAWSFRKLLEAHAAHGPLVCVFDDVHWGEETFLDLVEAVADLSRGAPILLLCIARPELLDRRPAWAGGKVNSTSVLLEPLGPAEAEAMISSLAVLDEDLRTRICDTAEGNPLFVEQMVALVKESGAENVTVPPTIHALLTARLEQLDVAERSVLERGAVEGRIFHAGAVQALAPEEDQVVARLTSLVRKELVRPDKPLFAGEDAFRFRHLLIRDATYDAMPKATRAELHQRFADWLRGHEGDLVELAEVLGYHLEQAYRCRAELGAMDDANAALGRQASALLAEAGRRASDRGDMSAAVNLLERAAALLPPDDADRGRLLPVLGRAFVERGQWEAAAAVMAEAIELGRTQGLPGVVAAAIVEQAFVDLHTQAERTHAHVQSELGKAVRLFEEAGDQRGLARAMTEAGRLPFWHGETLVAVERFEIAASHARAAGDRAQELDAGLGSLAAMIEGSTSMTSALERAHAMAELTTGGSRVDVGLLRCRGEIELALGHVEAATEFAEAARQLAEDLGLKLAAHTGVALLRGRIASAVDGATAAERVLRPACEALAQMGDVGHLVTSLPYLADALYELGRSDEIAGQVDEAAEAVVDEDMDGQVGMRRARAKVHAGRGELDEAERIVREALTYVERTDFLPLHCLVFEDLADLLLRSDRRTEAGAALESALVLHERKGSTGYAERVRRRLASLASPPDARPVR